jgi:hypothetical protein
VTPDQFRKLVLALPEVVEGEHMHHPDFRVRGRIFASLIGKDEVRGMVRLAPAQQKSFVAAEPEVFEVAGGSWGRNGCTYVRLKAARKPSVQRAVVAAWRGMAPEDVVREHEGE